MAIPNVSRPERTSRRLSDPHRADGSFVAQIHPMMLEACRSASLLMGGPSLSNFGVTSALRGEGRTAVALAMAAVQRDDFGRSVVLIDMDFENPCLAGHYGLDPSPGLAELVEGQADLDQVIQTVSDGVQLVGSGAISETATRPAMDIVRSGLLTEIAARADVLIGDLPPLLGGGSGHTAARAFDNLLMVVRAGITPVARVKEAASDIPVAPYVLLNGTHSSLPRWLRRLLGR